MTVGALDGGRPYTSFIPPALTSPLSDALRTPLRREELPRVSGGMTSSNGRGATPAARRRFLWLTPPPAFIPAPARAPPSTADDGRMSPAPSPVRDPPADPAADGGPDAREAVPESVPDRSPAPATEPFEAAAVIAENAAAPAAAALAAPAPAAATVGGAGQARRPGWTGTAALGGGRAPGDATERLAPTRNAESPSRIVVMLACVASGRAAGGTPAVRSNAAPCSPDRTAPDCSPGRSGRACRHGPKTLSI